MTDDKRSVYIERAEALHTLVGAAATTRVCTVLCVVKQMREDREKKEQRGMVERRGV